MISRNLKELRLKEKYTRKELGKIAGVTPTTIQLIENGKTNPRLKTVLALAKALNISITELI